MINKIFSQRRAATTPLRAETEEIVPSRQSYISVSPDVLLGSPTNTNWVHTIREALSITPEAWKFHYLEAINRTAALMQRLPASAGYHHSSAGGLLTHTLEATAASVRLAKGATLPPQVEPEELYLHGDRWRFGVFVTALAHDLGKVLTDMEVVYRVSDGNWTAWTPWSGPIPLGAEYQFRYRTTDPGQSTPKNLHELGSSTLFPFLLTTSSAAYIAKDRRLMFQILATLNRTPGAGEIGELVKAGDKNSVKNALATQQSAGSSGSALAPLLMESIKHLIRGQVLAGNRPGAAYWVNETGTWITSTTAIEAGRQKLIQDGVKGVPVAAQTLVGLLGDAGYLVHTPTGAYTWHSIIKDTERDWSYKFWTIRVPNSLIWDEQIPLYDGEVIPLTKQGKPLPKGTWETLSAKMSPQPPNLTGQSVTEPLNDDVDESPHPEALTSNATVCKESTIESSAEAIEGTTNRTKGEGATLSDTVENSSVVEVATVEEPRSVTDIDVGSPKQDKLARQKPTNRKTTSAGPSQSKPKTLSSLNKSLVKKHDWFAWLMDGLDDHTIKINEPKAFIHKVDGNLAAITPKAFIEFGKQSRAVTNAVDQQAAIREVQRKVQRLGLHLGAGPNDYQELHLSTPTKTSTLRAIVFKKGSIEGLERFSDNPALKLYV